MSAPIFSVVVVSWRTRDLTLACLESVAADRSVEKQVILVDNDSGDGTAEAVRERFPETLIVESGRNAGFAAACNMAVAHSRSELVLFLNPDARLTQGTLGVLARFFAEHAEVDIVGPLLVGESGEPQFSSGRFLTVTNQFAETLGLHRLIDVAAFRRSYDVGSADAPMRVDWVTGACMAARRSALDRTNGFDEQFFMYAEDEDLCRRVAGQVFLLPSLQIVHEGGRSAVQDFARMKDAARLSQALYMRKHRGRIAEVAFRLLMMMARLKPTREKGRVGWGS